MENALLDAVHRFTSIYTDEMGIAKTPIPGLTIVRELVPTALQFAINFPMVALVLQGNKRVMLGSDTYDFGAGDSLLITADVPTVSQITRASAAKPYYSLIVQLNPAVIATLVDEIGSSPFAAGQPVRVDPTDGEVADTALRLMRMINRPASLSVLQDQLIRELHFWLLSGRHGGAIRALGVTDSHVERIRRAVAIIRARHADLLPVELLAKAAGMGTSSFHAHFRAATSLTPLQFQKQIRLIEARRMMMANGAPISNAAYAVGYESIPQFTREYGRLFGQSPARDLRSTRSQVRSSA